MKKTLALICALVLVVLSLAACGNSVEGTWKLDSTNLADTMGQMPEGADVKVDTDGKMELKSDKTFTLEFTGTVSMTMEGIDPIKQEMKMTGNGTYEVDGDTVKFTMKHMSQTANGETTESDDVSTSDATIKDGKLTFESDNMKMVFKK